MKKVRTIINTALGSMVAALGLTACGSSEITCEYGVPIEKYGCPIDTTVRCMYGVDPVVIDQPEETKE